MEEDIIKIAHKIGAEILRQEKEEMRTRIALGSNIESPLMVVPKNASGQEIFNELQKVVLTNNIKEYVILFIKDVSMLNKKTQREEKHKALVEQMYTEDGRSNLAFYFFRIDSGFLGINSKIEFYNEKNLSEIEANGKETIASISFGCSLNVYK